MVLGSSPVAVTSVHFKFYLNQCFEISQLLKYDSNIVVKYVFSVSCCGKGFLKPLRLKFRIRYVAREIHYFEIGIFSFTSYVYYLTRGFIA